VPAACCPSRRVRSIDVDPRQTDQGMQAVLEQRVTAGIPKVITVHSPPDDRRRHRCAVELSLLPLPEDGVARELLPVDQIAGVAETEPSGVVQSARRFLTAALSPRTRSSAVNTMRDHGCDPRPPKLCLFAASARPFP